MREPLAPLQGMSTGALGLVGLGSLVFPKTLGYFVAQYAMRTPSLLNGVQISAHAGDPAPFGKCFEAGHSSGACSS